MSEQKQVCPRCGEIMKHITTDYYQRHYWCEFDGIHMVINTLPDDTEIEINVPKNW